LIDYFKKRKALKAVIIFMDIRHPLKDSDIEMIKLCTKSDVDFIPVLTKSDKLSNNKIANSVKGVNKRLIGCEAIAISAKDQKGIELLSKEIMRYCSA
jgi:GTP-binding protein